MFNKFKHIKNEKGLTLIELLAVIVILAIIAAIAIPAIGNIIDSSRVKAAKADAANILSSAQLYFTENTAATEFTGAKTKPDADTPEWKAYVTDLGTIETFTVSKTAGTVTTTGTSGGKKYTIDETTLADLKIEDGKADGKFKWDNDTKE